MIQAGTPTTTKGSAASFTFAHTVASNNDRFMRVGVALRANAGQTVTGVTFNGVAMLRQTFVVFNNQRQERWYMTAPSVGTFNVVVTLSAAAVAVCGANDFWGVDQLTPIGNTFNASGNSTTPSVNVTLSEPDPTVCLVIDGLSAMEVGGFTLVATPAAGQTQEWQDKTAFSPAGNNPLGAASRRFATVAVQVMSWTLSSATDWAFSASYLRPARARIAFNAKGSATGNFSPAGPYDFVLQARLRNLEARVGRHDRRLRD